MNICEGCIKQDVFKFKDEVEQYDMKLPEPLEPIVECKYKRTENWTYTSPSVWTDCTWTTTTRGDSSTTYTLVDYMRIN